LGSGIYYPFQESTKQSPIIEPTIINIHNYKKISSLLNFIYLNLVSLFEIQNNVLYLSTVVRWLEKMTNISSTGD